MASIREGLETVQATDSVLACKPVGCFVLCVVLLIKTRPPWMLCKHSTTHPTPYYTLGPLAESLKTEKDVSQAKVFSSGDSYNQVLSMLALVAPGRCIWKFNSWWEAHCLDLNGFSGQCQGSDWEPLRLGKLVWRHLRACQYTKTQQEKPTLPSALKLFLS